jgi:hypothetical protein
LRLPDLSVSAPTFLPSQIRNCTNSKNDAANERRFAREYSPVPKTEHGQMIVNYENHYNARLKKCFFLEIANTYERKEGKPTTSKIMRLFDLNDNKQYGIYMSGFSIDGPPFGCEVQDKGCRSESEWRQLLKPFMED